MMMEFYQDLLPVLLAAGVYMTFATAHLMRFMVHEAASVNSATARKQLPLMHNGKLPQRVLKDLRMAKLTWIVRMIGRKEGPEDDPDYMASRNSVIQTFRGGFSWTKNLDLPLSGRMRC